MFDRGKRSLTRISRTQASDVAQALLTNVTYLFRGCDCVGIGGADPWSAAGAPVGLRALCKMRISLFRQRDGGVPRGPGGPPHHFRSCRARGEN